MSERLTSTLEEFRDQLNHPNEHRANFSVPSEAKLVKVKKTSVIVFQSDSGGTAQIRNLFITNYLNSVYTRSRSVYFINMPFFFDTHNLLFGARAIMFPKVMDDAGIEAMKRLRVLKAKYNYKMVYDIDDFVWFGEDKGERFPTYNSASTVISKKIAENVTTAMTLVDEITVSTDFLKSYITNTLKIKTPVTVIPNCVPRYFYAGCEVFPITEKLIKPRVIYTGAQGHYCMQSKPSYTAEDYGDFANSAWLEWIIKSVKEDKIEFICMGCSNTATGLQPPFFFEPIKDKIRMIAWVNIYKYHQAIIDAKPHFSIGPLVSGEYFNYAKSDLKFVESAAYNAVFMGSTFTDMPSPYDNCFATVPETMSVDALDTMFDKLCEPEEYNRIIMQQRAMLDSGRWLESKEYINKFLSVL